MSEPDIRLQVRVKNARVLRAMQRAGIDTVAELLRRMTGGNQSEVGAIINFRKRPLNKDGEWRQSALEMATALGVEPDHLWPEYLREIEAKKTEVSIDMEISQFEALVGSERSLIDHDLTQRLLAGLNQREARIIEMRFGLNGNGEHTLEEVGEEFGVSRARIRQIQDRAVRRMTKKVRAIA